MSKSSKCAKHSAAAHPDVHGLGDLADLGDLVHAGAPVPCTIQVLPASGGSAAAGSFTGVLATITHGRHAPGIPDRLRSSMIPSKALVVLNDGTLLAVIDYHNHARHGQLDAAALAGEFSVIRLDHTPRKPQPDKYDPAATCTAVVGDATNIEVLGESPHIPAFNLLITVLSNAESDVRFHGCHLVLPTTFLAPGQSLARTASDAEALKLPALLVSRTSNNSLVPQDGQLLLLAQERLILQLSGGWLIGRAAGHDGCNAAVERTTDVLRALHDGAGGPSAVRASIPPTTGTFTIVNGIVTDYVAVPPPAAAAAANGPAAGLAPLVGAAGPSLAPQPN
ncbi:hypothetical protein GPECTOR_424g288 [Gonium pectorale]|uniref:Uncharacterized protein n=1 Tax=Gonium pectorale TaxID=33097 RepID=A0A150FV78_GONPE|nr:hypothetical protein GPECTOR_424g288 [Gonium pectorale]|eukprot:KXZ41507.1 hypothetical protein GPECTOR_424g288 [Gonium pectorale]